MNTRYVRPAGLLVLVAVPAAMFALAGPAAASSRSSCYIHTKKRYPTLISPCNRARIAAGSKVTFKVRDLNPSAYKFKPTLNLSRHAPRHGRLRDDTSAFGLFAGVHSVKGHHGLFSLTPVRFTYHGYWEVTPGRYYIQIQQIEASCTTPHCLVYSPVTSITIH